MKKKTLLEQKERINDIISLNEQTFRHGVFKNKNEGDGFRMWFNKKLPKEAKKIQLDPQGKFDNSYIVKALNTPYKGSTAGKVYLSSSNKKSWVPSFFQKEEEKVFDNTTFRNAFDGNKFRKWFNDTFPSEAKKIRLDPQGSFNNKYIINALNLPFKNTTVGTYYFKKGIKSIKPVKNYEWVSGTSKQVQQQIRYLKSIKFRKSFTILDDRNSMVFAVNRDFSLYRKFNVVTGKHRGDDKKIMTITNWYTNGLMDHLKKTYGEYQKTGSFTTAIDTIKDDYLGSPLFAVKNTPSGIYTRDNDLWGFLGKIRSLVLTSRFFESIYGTKYISWEDLNGKLIPIGFHGTQSKVRLDSINKIKPPKRRKMSYGCINFNDDDILTVNKFIKIGQHSFWLPDTTEDILKFE